MILRSYYFNDIMCRLQKMLFTVFKLLKKKEQVI